MSDLTHFNQQGEAHMVDVGAKESTHRRAVTSGFIVMEPATLKLIQQGEHKKGDVWASPVSPALWPLKRPQTWFHCATR